MVSSYAAMRRLAGVCQDLADKINMTE